MDDSLSSLFEGRSEAARMTLSQSLAPHRRLRLPARVSICSLSEPNLKRFEAFMGEQMIGFDKVVQLRRKIS